MNILILTLGVIKEIVSLSVICDYMFKSSPPQQCSQPFTTSKTEHGYNAASFLHSLDGRSCLQSNLSLANPFHEAESLSVAADAVERN